jgi:hypothetical protein
MRMPGLDFGFQEFSVHGKIPGLTSGKIELLNPIFLNLISCFPAEINRKTYQYFKNG